MNVSRNIISRAIAPQFRRNFMRGLVTGARYNGRHFHRFQVALFGGVGCGGLAFLLFSENKKILAETAKVDWKKLQEEIIEIMEDDDHDDGSYGPIFVRLAWHSSGTYCKHTKTGGSEGGTMRFSPEADHGANAGLHKARNRLEALAKKYPGVSHADLYVFAGL